MIRLLKVRITNDRTRQSLLIVAAQFLKSEAVKAFTLSQELCCHVIVLAQSFAEDLMNQSKAASLFHEKYAERNRAMRLLLFAIRDTQMGIIRRTRRHEKSPICFNTILIPDMRKRTDSDSNQWFEIARDLIAHKDRYQSSQEFTNPTIKELSERLDFAESAFWAAETAKEHLRSVSRQVAWTRTQVNGVIRQLNYELNYQLKGESRLDRIKKMMLFGFKWLEPIMPTGFEPAIL